MMPSSRIPSPARSQGAKSTPRRYKPRVSRSVGSPTCSNSSVKLTTIIQMNSFALSPTPSRRSILTDTTDIDIPRRKSWWKKLDENSREIMEVLNNKEPAEANNAIEEYIEVDVLSQEKKNYTLDIPESSDGESISSIVIPQRKLFTQKESKQQKKFAQIIDNRESLATLHKTQGDVDKMLNVGRKNLFNQGTKQRTKPLFPSALLNISTNKTIATKTKEPAATEAKGQVKSLFASRPDSKRRNMFADFIVSESEDEIPEIQPKVFEFHKKIDQKRRQSLNSHGGRESRLTSPTSSITDIEIDDWRLLPSSTMVDHQLEDGLRHTPSKKARLSKLSEAIESIDIESNSNTNKSKLVNKSNHSKNKSKNLSRFKGMDVKELFNSKTDFPELDIINGISKSTTKNMSHEKSLREETFKKTELRKSKNASVMKIFDEVVNVFENKNADTSRNYKCNKSQKQISKIDQVLQSDDDEDFTLVYENDNNDEVENERIRTIIGSELEDPKQCSIVNMYNVPKNVSMPKSQNIIPLTSQVDNDNNIDQQEDTSHNNSRKIRSNHSTRNKTRETSENSEIQIEQILHIDQVIDNGHNNSKCNKIYNYEEEEIQSALNNKDIDGQMARKEHNSSSTQMTNTEVDDTNEMRDQIRQDVEHDQQSVNEEVNTDEEVIQEEQNDEEQYTNYQNVSRDGRNKDIEENTEEEIRNHDNEKNQDDVKINNQENEKFNDHEDVEEKADTFGGDVELSSNEKKVNDEMKNNEYEDNNNQQNEEKTQNERRKIVLKQNEHEQNKIDRGIINYENEDNSNNQDHFDDDNRINETTKHVEANITHDTTGRCIQKLGAKVQSPEVILYNKQSQVESFTVEGRNTSVRKTKSIIKNLTMRPSLVPVRDSTCCSNESRNSSVERSGWDSHRTTRATLRQTFGKDFTPRKSLRALVMEKSAKRKTNFIEINTELSRFPQANSTELPGSQPFAMDESDINPKINEFDHEVSQDKSDDAHHLLQFSDGRTNDRRQTSESNDAQDLYISNQKLLCNIEKSKDKTKIHETNGTLLNDIDYNDVKKTNGSSKAHEIEEFKQEMSRHINDPGDGRKNNKLDQTQDVNGSDDAHEVEESGREMSHDADDTDNAEDMNETDDSEEVNEADDSHEMDESDQEISRDIDDVENVEEMNDTDDSDEINVEQEINESIHKLSHEIDEADEERQIYESQEVSEPDIAQNINESDDEHVTNESDNAQETMKSGNAQETMESGNAQEMNETEDALEMDEYEDAHEMIESEHELSCSKNKADMQEMELDHEQSRRIRQTTLEMYLQRVKKQNMEKKRQLEDEIRNSLKARDRLNPFKIPDIPKQRRMKAQQTKPKAKPLKSSVIAINMLPVEVLEDMKYKPPKRYRPTNASWITKRLYKYLETKLEPKYDYKARVRSEKLVETIYNFTKDIRRHGVAPTEAVDTLKREMARLDVVKTHFEFYEFFHEYMPREVRVKVVPDVFNKISLPKYGVFSEILR